MSMHAISSPDASIPLVPPVSPPEFDRFKYFDINEQANGRLFAVHASVRVLSRRGRPRDSPLITRNLHINYNELTLNVIALKCV